MQPRPSPSDAASWGRPSCVDDKPALFDTSGERDRFLADQRRRRLNRRLDVRKPVTEAILHAIDDGLGRIDFAVAQLELRCRSEFSGRASVSFHPR